MIETPLTINDLACAAQSIQARLRANGYEERDPEKLNDQLLSLYLDMSDGVEVDQIVSLWWRIEKNFGRVS
ncbi:hypothetical protein SCBWM1_gp14 [Synechococcus phage S-CBWM1]|uniref:Uncharacterized protein n=1 Tax=Synechococcus phage S-CBWM1 TaxID=2053653 RepID=A0A3G1L3D1_9CAUD|nr:hypothetical protein HOU61_gp015 [Synechococcus phage S-CBWM1]ATW62698.1 hypothetical protein SCBWM1_gp14 [Synechococcus phage S-CBWM1]